MGLGDDLNDFLDALLDGKPTRKKGPSAGSRARGSRPQPFLGPGARDALSREVAHFEKPTLLSPAERPRTGSLASAPGAGYLSLPPHIQPSATARPWYERRAVSIEPGTSAYILDYPADLGVPADTQSVVYWSSVGTDQHLNSFYEFWLDGTIFEAISGAAQVGTILSPYRFAAAIRVKTLRLRVYNYNPTPFTYEVVVAGWID